MDEASVAEETRAYLSWFEDLERSVKPDQGVVSRHYRSRLLTAYSRYSMLKAAVQGAPSLCIADITVAQPGCGLFSALCDQFEAADCPIHAQALFVENVTNRRFIGWLERRGFLLCPHSNLQLLPTLYLACARTPTTKG
ncbi:hypothetical protein C7T35_37500 [Variovorax sp. WS11]|uniref:hypothetical protein n=1 Tax=Variovorax sp. WS11 TaxID=1105204 RepID=UPI000D0DEF72|nr:hypothetical protein [Variovorax sp. WS11]NDZ17206.1 hypothetical protein [Variovorax sp. WS11]PSL79449.1 hypothetical protein C7T35_37500 [Variovorax sp. WS11]